jgi:hypothetical protein
LKKKTTLDIPCDFCQQVEATRQDYRTSNIGTVAEQTDKYLVCEDCLWLSDYQLKELGYW